MRLLAFREHSVWVYWIYYFTASFSDAILISSMKITSTKRESRSLFCVRDQREPHSLNNLPEIWFIRTKRWPRNISKNVQCKGKTTFGLLWFENEFGEIEIFRAEVVGKHAVDLIKIAENGSVWISDNGTLEQVFMTTYNLPEDLQWHYRIDDLLTESFDGRSIHSILSEINL